MLRSTTLPWAAKYSSTIRFTTGLQEPQVLPAEVLVSCSAASTMSALHTLLHEQTTASSGSPRSAPPRLAGRISSSGLSGSSMPLATIGRRTPYAVASPTSTPPRRRRPSSETTSFL